MKRRISLSPTDIEQLEKGIVSVSLSSQLDRRDPPSNGSSRSVTIKRTREAWEVSAYSSKLLHLAICQTGDGVTTILRSVKNPKEYCAVGFEMCRIRPSVSNLVSLVVLLTSVYLVCESVLSSEFLSAVRDAAQGEDRTIRQAADFIWICRIFAIVYLVQLLRIYTSTLMMESDPAFYFQTLHPLNHSRLLRYGELILRVGVMGAVVVSTGFQLFAKLQARSSGSSAVTQLNGANVFSSSFFSPILWVLIACVTWDIWLCMGAGLPRRKTKRFFFLVNDLLGFALVLWFAIISVSPLRFVADSSFVWSVSVMAIAVFVSIVLLLADMCVNGMSYMAFVQNELVRWAIPQHCGENCPYE